MPQYFIWYGLAFRDRYLDEILLGLFHPFADGLGYLIGLAQAIADKAVAVADHDQRREAETAAPFDNLGYTADMDNSVRKI